jgi:hypothetical protein
MTDEQAKPAMTVQLIVCSGVTELDDGKLGMILQAVDEAGKISGERHPFSEKACRKGNIFLGGMYKVDANENLTSVVMNSAKYQGLWPNEVERTRWKADERALEIERAARKRQAADKSRNAMLDALRPIREAWQSTNSVGKLALEVQVLAYIRGMKIAEKRRDWE